MADEPLATWQDVQSGWRPLSSAEQERATELIERASRKVRRRWPDVDDRIEAETLGAEDVTDYVAEMVQVAMTQPQPGVSKTDETAGPFHQGLTFTNPNARLYFTDEMVEFFDGLPTVRATTRWLA